MSELGTSSCVVHFWNYFPHPSELRRGLILDHFNFHVLHVQVSFLLDVFIFGVISLLSLTPSVLHRELISNFHVLMFEQWFSGSLSSFLEFFQCFHSSSLLLGLRRGLMSADSNFHIFL